MLIQDAPDPQDPGDGDDDDTDDDTDTGPPYGGNGFLLDPGPGPDGYPGDGYSQRGYAEDGYSPAGYQQDAYPADRIGGDRYPGSGYADSPDYWAGPPGFRDVPSPEPGYDRSLYEQPEGPGQGYPDSGDPGIRYSGPAYPDSGHGGVGYPGSGVLDPGLLDPARSGSGYADAESWYGPEGDGFRPPLPLDDDSWDDGEYGPDPEDGYGPDPEDERPARRIPPLAVLFLRRDYRDRDPDGPRRFTSRPQRLGGLLLAGASVVGAAVYVPSILAANSHSLTGVVSGSGIASLNFGASGRVATVRVHLGQVVRRGELLATEAGPAKTAAFRADRAAITADKANLAVLQADGSAAASITAARAQLAKDRARRAADQVKVGDTEIVAPRTGTVVAIFGQPGETVSPAGLRGSTARAQASRTVSLLPSGPVASLRATGVALPVIALRTGGGWQVRLLIPQTSASAVKVGANVTVSIPAAQLSGVRGTITEVSPTPVTSSGGAGYEAVVRVLGRTRITPLSGTTADVQLGSLRRHGQAAPAAAHRLPAHPAAAGTGG